MNKSVPYLPSRAAGIKLAVAWAIVASFQFGLHSLLGPDMSVPVAASLFALLFGTILMAAFGAVHEADELAHQLGEPYGTLILTTSIVVIEVVLIAAVMLGPSASATIGRDSIFAVMMIIMNLVTGICLLAGGIRYGEQEYNAPGAITFISVILVFVGVAFLLPNYTGSGDGTFTPVQAVVVSVLILVGYAAFLALQMGRYRTDFVQPKTGSMRILLREARRREATDDQAQAVGRGSNLKHAITLIALILPIVLLAHDLSIIIDYGVEAAGAPAALSGVLIAIIVFTPESVTAVRAALDDQTQRAINLCLGAFVSTVGLTVPAVLVVGLVTGKSVVFGISETETVLMALTVALTTLTFMGHRTSATQGMLHLLLFGVFGLMLFTV
ncbi:Sodium/proton antiporter ChaA [Roseivivax jejudonensis]|uniref:Sodium/proton antiporter ChaA n=1 Tax=Roseivivax jejudonensis TaxID=1529041 RepID=A0A1X6Y6E6_9RHOB|nr:calcium:proton antiporter [Roseivivax jejudonensis]SLN11879.1 Sodium/proton antiporter ChaA [Roseivivax jejudonensis]